MDFGTLTFQPLDTLPWDIDDEEDPEFFPELRYRMPRGIVLRTTSGDYELIGDEIAGTHSADCVEGPSWIEMTESGNGRGKRYDAWAWLPGFEPTK